MVTRPLKIYSTLPRPGLKPSCSSARTSGRLGWSCVSFYRTILQSRWNWAVNKLWSVERISKGMRHHRNLCTIGPFHEFYCFRIAGNTTTSFPIALDPLTWVLRKNRCLLNNLVVVGYHQTCQLSSVGYGNATVRGVSFFLSFRPFCLFFSF